MRSIDWKFGNVNGTCWDCGRVLLNKFGFSITFPETKNTYWFTICISIFTLADDKKSRFFNPGILICGLHPNTWCNALTIRATCPGNRRTYNIG